VAVHTNDASSLAQKQKQLEVSASKDRTQLRKCEGQIVEQEALITVLQQQAQMELKSVSELADSISAAKTKLAQLESQQSQKQEDLELLEKESADAAGKLERARQEAAKLEFSASATELNVRIMQQEVRRARELVNPLNHPRVKSLLGRK
jgi:chromosome segregation ATPase